MEETQRLRSKYRLTSWVYDVLDYPWERRYRRWRPGLLAELEGRVLKAGVGTGRNLEYYPPGVQLTGLDLSPEMLTRARRRARRSPAAVTLIEGDATSLPQPDGEFDWYISTFMFCVMPPEVQRLALSEMARVLRPGGRFRLLEIKWSKSPRMRRNQERLSPLAGCLYGAGFDRRTLEHVEGTPGLEVSATRFLHADTYQLINGYRA